jgi:hypothetical protein
MGFQLAARTGYAIPFGDATSNAGDSMGNLVSGQFSLLLDAGWKFWPRVFLGGYAGLGWGPAAGAAGQVCQVEQVGCSAATIRFGLEVTYAFGPAASMNPWVGYASASKRWISATATTSTCLPADGSSGTCWGV